MPRFNQLLSTKDFIKMYIMPASLNKLKRNFDGVLKLWQVSHIYSTRKAKDDSDDSDGGVQSESEDQSDPEPADYQSDEQTDNIRETNNVCRIINESDAIARNNRNESMGLQWFLSESVMREYKQRMLEMCPGNVLKYDPKRWTIVHAALLMDQGLFTAEDAISEIRKYWTADELPLSLLASPSQVSNATHSQLRVQLSLLLQSHDSPCIKPVASQPDTREETKAEAPPTQKPKSTLMQMFKKAPQQPKEESKELITATPSKPVIQKTLAFGKPQPK